MIANFSFSIFFAYGNMRYCKNCLGLIIKNPEFVIYDHDEDCEECPTESNIPVHDTIGRVFAVQ
jgi:hypothetical protein